ncbi:C-GCAxxG-C-C family (seleno)protein [Zhaonella formicivorans]|uniref:C-GCAxxG-C-C family (seleno)protein n=1 Tax=Zhaonella formicivorans TaxID=2528593 RepID=UPI0010F28167|nr:C-GCAxxG-C-C family (seleno)protein [Zhaonella formicivorans]
MAEKNKEISLSRRKFLAGAGALAAGVVTAGSVFGVNPVEALSAEKVNVVVNGKKIAGANISKGVTVAPVREVVEPMGAKLDWDNATRTVTITGKVGEVVTAPAEQPSFPWPYVKLDPEAAYKDGYDFYFSKGGCMPSAALAIIKQLREKVGYPYTLLPDEMFKYGSGGAGGWGTLCGALNGALLVMNLVDPKYADILEELMGWYTTFPFPSSKHEAYAKFKGQITTVANSPLCHASVSKWCVAAGAKVNSPEKYDRCAKLSGDVAAKAIELLNAKLIDKNFTKSYTVPAEFAACMGCHQGKDSMLDNEQGKMNCVNCHDDAGYKEIPHKK